MIMLSCSLFENGGSSTLSNDISKLQLWPSVSCLFTWKKSLIYTCFDSIISGMSYIIRAWYAGDVLPSMTSSRMIFSDLYESWYMARSTVLTKFRSRWISSCCGYKSLILNVSFRIRSPSIICSISDPFAFDSLRFFPIFN